MAKLYSTPAQLIALRGLCSRDRTVSGLLLSQLDASHFYGDHCLEAYGAIQRHLETRGSTPLYSVLVENPALSKATRALLREVAGAVKSKGEVDSLVAQLNEYRHTRIFYELCQGGLDMLRQDGKLSVEAMVTLTQSKLASMQVSKSIESQITRIGKNHSATDLIEEIIYGEETDNFIPMGYKVFDRVNGGMIRGSLVTFGGASGAGKSHLVLQTSKNQASMGYKVVVVPLEMSRTEMLIRYLANVANIDSLRISRKTLTTAEQDTLWKAYHRFCKKIARAGGQWDIYQPDTDVSIEEVLATAHSYNPDVIYIDYAGLLKGADGEDQWRKLGNIFRYAKVYAGNHNKVVVICAQVDDEGRIRYSQAIKEHSSLGFTFVATKESREHGFLNFHMIKGRNQQLIDFALKINYATSTFRDLEPSELAVVASATTPKGAASSTQATGSKASAKPAANKRDFVPAEEDD